MAAVLVLAVEAAAGAGDGAELLGLAPAEDEGGLLAGVAGEAALVEAAVFEAAGVEVPAASLDLLFLDFFAASLVVAAVAPVSEDFALLDLLASPG